MKVDLYLLGIVIGSVFGFGIGCMWVYYLSKKEVSSSNTEKLKGGENEKV